MQIRKYTAEDFDKAFPLIVDFYREHLERLGLPYDEASARAFLGMFGGSVPGMIGLVAIDDAGDLCGFISGIINPWIFDRAKTIFEEIGWYVSPKHRAGTVGLKLYRELERYLVELGVSAIHMATLSSSRSSADEFLVRRGFKEQEVKWLKVL